MHWNILVFTAFHLYIPTFPSAMPPRRSRAVSLSPSSSPSSQMEAVLTDDPSVLSMPEDLPPVAEILVSSKSNDSPTPPPKTLPDASVMPAGLAPDDLQTLSHICSQYDDIKDAYDISFQAKWEGTRQMTIFIVCFLLVLEIIGVAVFMRKAGYSLSQALLFSHYSFTSCGYGNYPIPDTPGYQIFLILYMLLGIGSVTILAAQVYQYLIIRSKYHKHQQQRDIITPGIENEGKQNGENVGVTTKSGNGGWCRYLLCGYPENNTAFRVVFVVALLLGLLLSGTFAMMGIEGMTFAQALYFSSFTMLTTGFGDVVPVTEAGTWFTVFWLPTNVLFLAVFWGNVVNLYAFFADWNVSRHEHDIKSQMAASNERKRLETEADLEKIASAEDGDVDGKSKGRSSAEFPKSHKSNSIASPSVNQSSRYTGIRALPSIMDPEDESNMIRDRRHIKTLSDLSGMFQQTTSEHEASVFRTMNDVISFVRSNMMARDEDVDLERNVSDSMKKFFTVESTSKSSLPFHENGARIPSFALLLLVQERFAHILTKDVFGIDQSHHIDMTKGNTIGISIESLSSAMRKWRIPRGARPAFVAVAFEALLFVGAETMSAGPDALLEELTPFECQALFSPLLAGLGDAGTMEGWLAQTEIIMVLDNNERNGLHLTAAEEDNLNENK